MILNVKREKQQHDDHDHILLVQRQEDLTLTKVAGINPQTPPWTLNVIIVFPHGFNVYVVLCVGLQLNCCAFFQTRVKTPRF